MKRIGKQFLMCVLVFAAMIPVKGTNAFAGDGQSGDPNVQIVGGKNADIKDYPWQVAIYRVNPDGSITRQTCGGTIINPSWILTAAHCVSSTSHKNQRIIAQISRLSQRTQGQIIEISDCIIHPDYDTETVTNDVALLRLSIPIDTSVLGAKVIRMLTPSEESAGLINPGVMATITGWGTTKYTGSSPDILQVGTLPIISIDTANIWFKEVDPEFEYKVTAGMLPACFAEGGVSGCHGDSGGPFVVKDETNSWALAGITSWGNICGGAKQPAVYSRVPYYYDWIISNTKLGQEPSPTKPDYVDIVKIIVSKKTYFCGEINNLGEVLIRNNGTDFLESFEMTVKIGTSADDFISSDTKVIQLDSPLPSLGTKRIDLFGALPEQIGNYYIEVSVSKPNQENIVLANNIAGTTFELIEPNPLKLNFILDSISSFHWAVINISDYSAAAEGYYDSSQSGDTINESVCLKDGEYTFIMTNTNKVKSYLSFSMDGNEYTFFYKDFTTSLNTTDFTVPFVPINDLSLNTTSNFIKDSVIVCNTDQIKDKLGMYFSNDGTLPAKDIIYRVTMNGIVEDIPYPWVPFPTRKVFFNLNSKNLIYGKNELKIEILSYNGYDLDVVPANNIVEKTIYIVQKPVYGLLETMTDKNYMYYGWMISRNSDGSTIMYHQVEDSLSYITNICLDYGCFTFQPINFSDTGIPKDTAAILRKPNGEIIFAIKGSDFLESNPVVFCNIETGIQEETNYGLNIYPNPAVDFVNLSFRSVRNADATVEISDVLGNKLYSIDKLLAFGENLIQLDVSALSNGVYLVRLISGNEIVAKMITVGR